MCLRSHPRLVFGEGVSTGGAAPGALPAQGEAALWPQGQAVFGLLRAGEQSPGRSWDLVLSNVDK